MKILHVITSLHQGGAQSVMADLVIRSREGVKHKVVSMLSGGVYASKLRLHGIDVEGLGLSQRWPSPRALLAMQNILRMYRPDVVQTWMYHADLFGGISAFLAGNRCIIWGIRHASFEPECDRLRTRWIARLCAYLSPRLPSSIVCCSEEGARVHRELGYSSGKIRLIPNGYDLLRFRPDDAARNAVRREWGIGEGQIAVGMVGRWHPVKDHALFLNAVSRLRGLCSGGCCVLAGPGITEDNSELMGLLRELKLRDKVRLLGARSDIPAVMNGLDVHVLSSRSEAFPNVVAEAMACGTPCVTTAVGDSEFIVGDRERLVPPQNLGGLVAAIDRAIARNRCEGRKAIGDKCRRRIMERYSLERMVGCYEALWRDAVNGRSIKKPGLAA